MAKEKPRCVLCGQETGFLNRAYLPLYNTNQVVCAQCMKDYMESDREEQGRLKEKMMNSPYLLDRERIQSLLDWRQEEQDADDQTAVRQESSAICCTQRMDLRGMTRLPLAPGAAGGDTIELAVYECAMCGRVKLFRAE